MVERSDMECEVAGGHFAACLGRFAASSGAAIAWFRQHFGWGAVDDTPGAGLAQVEGRRQ